LVEAVRDEFMRFFATVLPRLNEVQRRVVAGAMAITLVRMVQEVRVTPAAASMSRTFFCAYPRN
jgi:hypothetical protein